MPHPGMSRRLCLLLAIRLLIVVAALAPPTSNCQGGDDIRFNRDVLPILADYCFACHGFDKATRAAGLRLDSFAGATSELESGARAIVPRKLAESELVVRLFATDDSAMPPKETGKQLSDAQKETLKRWIEQGARYEPHWAFVAPRLVEPPVVADVEHPIDRFIRARLAQANLAPSPAADPAILLRRVTLDLTGLPPTPFELDAFLIDSRPDAYERVVDRLLASEHFGERWARWWLDLAHYADSDGYLQDFIRPVAWRYRQWVTDAFNRDLPFDRFTIEQLAGDLLPDASITQRMGTGFLRNTLSNREGGAELEEFRVAQAVDRTIMFGTTWLGLTTGCAQCHDHKFDPLTQREFYQLYAFFNDADEANFNAPLSGEREPWEAAKKDHDRKRSALLAPVAERLQKLQEDWENKLLHAEEHPGKDFAWDRALELLGLQWGQNLGEGQLEGLNLIKTSPSLRTQDERDRLLDYFLKNAGPVYRAEYKELNLNELRGKLDALAKELPAVTRAPGMTRAPVPRRTHIHIRGEFRRKGDEVRPGTPAALPKLDVEGDLDRLTLAQWLVSPEHPLTARVTVNRLWQELFGRGIVASSENFGVRGNRPSHPELLDWLALELQRRQWGIKEMLRLIVLSATYRQSSSMRPDLTIADPNNAMLARQNRLRLSAESVRDCSLAASGLLCRTMGGPSVKPPQPASVSKEGFRNQWPVSAGADRYRRGLYTFLQRTSPFAQLVAFDLPDTSRSCSRRERSNTPLQALHLLNDPYFMEAARAMAARVWRESRGNDAQRIELAFALALCRSPKPEESRRLLDYLRQQELYFARDGAAARELLQDAEPLGAANQHAAWIALCSVLLNLDEFINRE